MVDLKSADAAATKAAPASGTGTPILSVQNLEAWYGESHILHGINFEVNAGEVVTLLGRNGAGKTTTLKSVMGIIGKRTGSIRFDGAGYHPRLVGQDCAHGHRVLSGGARDFRQP
jgi:branched-chain amino acid transport system ATP-binding protein